MSGFEVILLAMLQTVGCMLGFFLGAWVRSPFKLGGWKRGESTKEERELATKRQNQTSSVMNYSIDDAKRAVRERGGM